MHGLNAIFKHRGKQMDGTIGIQMDAAFVIDRTIQANELADLIDVPEATLRGWLRLAASCMCPLGKRDGPGRYLSGYESYILAVLAALHKANIDVTASRLCEVFVVCRGERPNAPDLGDRMRLTEKDADGRPTAYVIVELAQVFLEFQAKFRKWRVENGR
ncbi:hypothetical protein [Bosea sp. (in: a-proteobacteria)]|uniref:hypothetical protein n=1 Tax=Bosea sp. (in: a-proteobacteria) TaxID=1871050 RepID=UPI002B47B3A2|nr:hypothetical protein [Bosea sp. (in: a-proteobacteria)]WRH59172.1 MAG: hypothetical protein RSE11_05125 [Bosea sp. (in: a-proteobacteria)]